MLKYKWECFIGIMVLLAFGTLTLAFIAYDDAPPKVSPLLEATKTVLLCLGGIGVILPVYLNAVSHFEAHRQKIIENTFSLLVRWDSPDLFLARKFTREIRDMHSTLSADELKKRIEDTPEIRQSVILVANFFDHVRFSLETKRIDGKLLNHSLGELIVDIINRFDPYFSTLGSGFHDDLMKLKRQLEKL